MRRRCRSCSRLPPRRLLRNGIRTLWKASFTEDELDAKKVAELVSMLPGLDGCMLVKNHGAVLASQLPERLHRLLTVPDRNYELLFDRLENKVQDRHIENARLATFELGDDALTMAQSDHAFLFANHKETKLRPGLAGKLAAIVSEVAKMYPSPEN